MESKSEFFDRKCVEITECQNECKRLNAENAALRDEIKRIEKNSREIREENAVLRKYYRLDGEATDSEISRMICDFKVWYLEKEKEKTDKELLAARQAIQSNIMFGAGVLSYAGQGGYYV